MGDFNQYLWVKDNSGLLKSDAIEVGSKFYSGSSFNDFRKLCGENNITYVGADLSEGKNVDIALDFTDDLSKIESKLQKKFRTAICCSVMEHVKDIFRFANNLSAIIEPGGTLFLSVPFTWEFHGYPNDYWRFTPPAVEYLFPQFDFPGKYRTISSHIPHDIKPLGVSPNDFCYSTLLKGTADPASAKGPLNILRTALSIFKHRKVQNERILYNSIGTTRYFRPSCINMIGIKK